MSATLPRSNAGRRLFAFLFICTSSVGLVLLVLALAGKTPAHAESAMAPLAPQAVDLEISKDGPDDTLVEQIIIYTIHITNNTSSPINNVAITDTWLALIGGGRTGPPAEFNGTYWTQPPEFASQLTFTYTPPTEEHQSGFARWDVIGSLPASAQRTIQFTMFVTNALQPVEAEDYDVVVGPSELNNSVKISGDGVTVNDPDIVGTSVNGPVLTMTKSYTSEVGPRPGRLLTFTLRLRNLSTEERSDSIPATGIVIAESLPNELIFQDAWAEVIGTITDYDPGNRRITWTLPIAYQLQPGEMTAVTFTARLHSDQEWKKTFYNHADACWAIANELANPIECWDRLTIKTLGIFDKTYETEPETKKKGSGYDSLEPNKTYPNHLVTYTVRIFNPLSQSVVNNLRITDIMPSTWDFERMVDGPDPVWPTPLSAITNTMVWQWGSNAMPADGMLEFSFVARVGPDTPVDEPFCNSASYYNDLAASASEFPLVYKYGESFKESKGLAEIFVVEQTIIELPSVTPASQYPGLVVTYTLRLHNQGNRPVHNVRFTDTLPSLMPYWPIYFYYESMVDGIAPVFTDQNLVVWDIPQIDAQSIYELSFRAVVNGVWGAKHYSILDLYSPETNSCTRNNRAPVTVLSPLVYEKTADPPLEGDEWVVQGEQFQYTVEFWNRSPAFDYNVDQFWDDLPIVKLVNSARVDFGGFEVGGNQDYVYSISPTFTLQANYGNSWGPHTFVVDTPGEGAGTDWCNSLAIDEDSFLNKYKEQEIYQYGSTTYPPGTFGMHVVEGDITTTNVVKESPIFFKPHVDLFHDIHPNKASFGSTVAVTLTLRNNFRGAQTRSVDNITLTYQLPAGFEFLNVVTPTPPPTTFTVGGEVIWTGVNLPAGEGQERQFRFDLRAPFKKSSTSQGYATARPQDPSVCVPDNESRAAVVKGVELEKVPNLSTVGPFGIIEYELELVNQTSAIVNDFVLTDTLPPDFEFVSAVQGPPPDTITGEQLVWRGLRLEPIGESGDDIILRFKARAPGLVGIYYNMVSAFSPSTYFTYSWDLEHYKEDVKVIVGAGVGMYKVVSPQQTMAGETVVYTLTVDNRSGEAISGVRITDTLPDGFTFQGMISGTNPIATAPEIVWQLSEDIANNDKLDLAFTIATDPLLSSGVYYNQASATAHRPGRPGDLVFIPGTDLIAPVSVKGLPTIQRTKKASPSTVRAGNLVTYTITLYNDSGAPQTLRLTDTLPLSLTYAGIVGPTPAPVSTSPLVWQNLSLDISETLTLTFRAQVDLYTRSGTYYNQLDAATTEFTLPPKLLAPLQVEEVPRYDLQVTKRDGWTKVDEGQALIYTIAYTNATQAGLTLNNVVITDTFSPQLYLSPIGLGGGWQQIAPDQYTYVVGDLGPGESGQVTFTLELATSIPDTIMLISNTAQIGHATAELAFETDASNNRSTDLNILHGSDLLVVGVEVSPAQPQADQPITFAVTVRNQGDDAAVNALGTGWFPVDLYLKGTGFEPAGPPGVVYPPAVFDHYGSYCGDYPDCAQIRPEYFVYATGLNGNEETTLQFTVIVPQAGDYELYVQVDTSFTGPSVEEPWGHDYGTVLEAIETNNIYSYGVVQVGMGSSAAMIYLPVILKGD